MTGGLFPGDTGDFITMGWPGSWTTVTGGTYPNGALPAFIDVAQSGNRSMMNPGISFRFVSGPSPTTIGVESEARGVVMTTLRANFSSTIGDTSPPLFQPFDRGMILLNPGGTVVNLRLPVRTTSEGVTIEAWLENPTSPNAGNFQSGSAAALCRTRLIIISVDILELTFLCSSVPRIIAPANGL